MFPVYLALLMVFGLASTSFIVTDWHHLPTPGPEVDWPLPRTGAATWQDASGDAWLFGGRAVEPLDEFFGDLWVFRSSERAWQQLTPLPGRGRHEAAMCGLSSHLLVIVGGIEEDGTLSGETVIFDLQHDVWRILTCSNDVINDTASNWLNCKHCNPKSNATNSCEICINASSNWTSVVCPTARRKAVVWCTDDTLWMVGGRDKNNEVPEDAWQLRVGADRIEWIPAPQASLPPSSSDVLQWTVGHSRPVVLTSLPMDGNQSFSLHQQLWIFQNTHWRSLDSNTRSIEVQWPSERTQASTWTDSFGNLWLYGGLALPQKSNFPLSGKRYEHHNDSGNILSQPWMYSLSANVWVKPEIRSSSPGPRAQAFAWSQRFHGYLFGGRTKCEVAFIDTHCACNDLWELNVTYTSQHVPPQYPVPESRNLPLYPPNESTGPPAAALTPINSSKMGLGSSKVPKGNDKTRSPWHEQHSDVFGSAIFFGISLSFFAVFGLVVFCRRCVSCPPQQHTLLKEPPPVRYTVIPDEIYIA